ncbi:phytanoyl-dioxygenase family protein [Moniliophthora roreri]|nr:phytanoyl-dioxygenase family protein [Moniliophthora roreri]
MPTSSIKQTYDTQGYVIVPNLISPSDFAELQAACDNVVNRTREGNWPHRRVVGKQFPPYDSENPDSWGVQHLMHPDLGDPAAIFAKWYTSDRLVNAVKVLLECNERDLQMELFNLLINPVSHDFALRWHRDDVRGDATEEEERKALGAWHSGVGGLSENT